MHSGRLFIFDLQFNRADTPHVFFAKSLDIPLKFRVEKITPPHFLGDPPMKRASFFACLAFAFLTAPAVRADDAAKTKDIVDTAVAAKFNTLVAAVKAGGLVDVLKSKGPFTVFAPTDEAFAALPKGTLEMLLKPENKSKLQAILKYHVVAGKVPAKVAMTLSEAGTVQGGKIKIAVKDGSVMINNAKVVKADVMCSNGVVHVIDKVLLPPSK